jgi:dihydrofolate reductase
MQIVLVVAKSENNVIGVDGDLPWKISADLKHFKAITMGHPIVMGRKTWDSIGRPLPGRRNIVITRRDDLVIDGVDVVKSIDAALDLCRADGAEKAMIVGGGQIYADIMDQADVIELTEVHSDIQGDTVFPMIDRDVWQETARQTTPADGDTPAYSFVTLTKR